MKKLIRQQDGFDIYFEAIPELTSLSEHLPEESKESINELYDKINTGSLVWFCAKVTAEKEGIELAADYLGGCLYESENDFINEDSGYFENMVQNVINDANEALPELIKKLQS